jgi:hypothetical protein
LAPLFLLRALNKGLQYESKQWRRQPESWEKFLREAAKESAAHAGGKESDAAGNPAPQVAAPQIIELHGLSLFCFEKIR